MRTWVLAILLFVFALTIRIWNLGAAGRWSDEQALVEKGYTQIELIKHHDFSNSFWYEKGADHPPLPFYSYGLASYKDLIKFDPHATPILTASNKGAPVFQYDFPNARSISLILSCLAVVLVFLVGVRYFSVFIGITAAIILAMLPHFVGYSQFVDLESWITFFFSAAAFAYFLYLEKNNRTFLILTGIIAGINVEVKQSNILIFPLFIATFFIWKKMTKKKNISPMHLFYIGVISLLTIIVISPMIFLHLPAFISYSYKLWINDNGLVPELIFGRHMGAHFFYYVVAFLVTTPVLIILLTFAGIRETFKKSKNWMYPAVLVWFLVPFLMSFFHFRQHLVRYIIEFYVPLSLLSAIGLESVSSLFTKKKKIKYEAIIPLVIYLGFILWKITPFYLEYYNELVGGAKNVYDKKLFFLGWFGEGLKEPGEYIAKSAHKNAKIGFAINPYSPSAIYQIPTLRYEKFQPNHKYDYVLVNYFDVIRLGFNENILKKNYSLVYTEKADGADLSRVYKHK